eukprot:IDg16399t1
MAMVFIAMHDAHLVHNTTSSIPALASTGYETLTRVLKSEPNKLVLLHARMSALGIARDSASAAIAMAALKRHPLTPPGGPGAYKPANPASTTYDATCNSIRAGDKWQPQCVQMKRGAPCMPQKVPFAPLRNASMASFGGKREVEEVLRTLPAPPAYAGALNELPFTDANRFAAQHRRVLAASATLNDRRKFQAELFVPNAAWLIANVAIDEA